MSDKSDNRVNIVTIKVAVMSRNQIKHFAQSQIQNLLRQLLQDEPKRTRPRLNEEAWWSDMNTWWGQRSLSHCHRHRRCGLPLYRIERLSCEGAIRLTLLLHWIWSRSILLHQHWEAVLVVEVPNSESTFLQGQRHGKRRLAVLLLGRQGDRVQNQWL